MAKRKSQVAKVARRAKRRKNPDTGGGEEPRENPLLRDDIPGYIVPAIAGYTAGRVAGRVAFKTLKGKGMTAGRAGGVLAPSLLAAGLWWWVHHRGREYLPQEETLWHSAVAGVAIAAVQSLIQVAIPQWGWILNDWHYDDQVLMPDAVNAPIAPGAGANGQQLPPSTDAAMDGDDDDPLADFDDLRSGIFA